MKKILLFFGLLIFGFIVSMSANGQNVAQRSCAAHDKHEEQMSNNAKYRMNQENIEAHYRRFKENGANAAVSGGVRTIPVYVHVLYRTSQENISDAQINSQIAVLNEDFSATNSDFGNIPSEFAGVAANYEIQFALAGITRKSTTKTSWGTNDAMKKSSQGGIDPITPDTHMNMWICNIGGGILGYAQFPGGSSATDGVVFSPQYCGSSDYDTNGTFYLDAPFDKGRTATHEVGHYLNLRHIWGDGGCSVDDFVSDTPTAGAANYGCPSYPTSSCSSNDMTMNYMDYVDDACMYMFTGGQKTRTASIFAPGGARENLGTVSGGCSLAAPSGLASSNIGDTNFNLSWNSVSGAVSYTVSINGSTSTVSGTSYSATGLSQGTTYSVMVRANCSSGSGSYSSALNVTTTGSNCSAGPVSLTLVTDNYASETSWTLKVNGTTVASNGSLSNNNTYNVDLDYGSGAYEFKINDSYGDGICCSYGNGSYTLRDGNNNVIATGGAFGSTTTENFCVEGGAPVDTQAPSTPGNVSSSNVTTESATISWNASSDNVGVDHYNLSVNGSSVGTTSNTSYSLTGLSAATSYSVSVTAEDAAGNVSGAGNTTFTTETPAQGGTTCASATNLSGSKRSWKHYSVDVPAGATSLNVDMSGGSGDADLYVRYGSQPTTGSYDCRPYKSGNNESCSFSNPNGGTWYVSIRGYSAYSGVSLEVCYDVPGARGTQPSLTDKGTSFDSGDFAIFPNPVSDRLFVDIKDIAEGTQVKIFSMSGMEVLSVNPAQLADGIDVTRLRKGIYFVSILDIKGENSTQKFIKR